MVLRRKSRYTNTIPLLHVPLLVSSYLDFIIYGMLHVTMCHVILRSLVNGRSLLDGNT